MNTKCIYAAWAARKLIKAGEKVVDIKANKENPDKTVFVFEKTPEFIEKMKTIINKEPNAKGETV